MNRRQHLAKPNGKICSGFASELHPDGIDLIQNNGKVQDVNILLKIFGLVYLLSVDKNKGTGNTIFAVGLTVADDQISRPRGCGKGIFINVGRACGTQILLWTEVEKMNAFNFFLYDI